MTTRAELERRLGDHLHAEAPAHAPDWVLESALTTIDTTPQRHRWVPWRITQMPIPLRVVAIAATLMAVILGPFALQSPGVETPTVPPLPPTSCPAVEALPSGTIATIAGTGSPGGAPGDGGPALEAVIQTWDRTSGFTGLPMAIDATGGILFSDLSTMAVRRIGTDGVITEVVGPATGAPIVTPGGLAIGDSGELYIADPGAARVWRLDPSGTITAIAGTGTPGSEGDDGPANQAQVQAGALHLGPRGELYIDDLYRIRVIEPDGTIRTVAGTGEQGLTPDGGSALTAMLGDSAYPAAVDPDGSIYVADPGNARIHRIDPDGVITTVAGGGSGPSGEGGRAIDASLTGSPYGVALDGDGGFLFSEWQRDRVYHVDSAGIITTVAGGGLQLGDCQPATDAILSQPQAIARDERGLFVIDGGHNQIRVVTP